MTKKAMVNIWKRKDTQNFFALAYEREQPTHRLRKGTPRGRMQKIFQEKKFSWDSDFYPTCGGKYGDQVYKEVERRKNQDPETFFSKAYTDFGYFPLEFFT